jgi:soluble lytic murein transglycosylase
MILLRLLTRGLTIAALAAALLPAHAQRGAKAPSASRDEAFLAAHAAFRASDPVKLARASAGLEGGILAPYLEYWALKLKLETAPQAEVRAYLDKHAGSYLADRLRADWLKDLGKKGDWQTFERELGALVNDDLDIRCYGWLARLQRGDAGAYEEARAIWKEARNLPEPCVALAGRKIEAGEAKPEVIWQRVRMLLENNQLPAARHAIALLPAGEAPDERLLQQASSSPQKVVASPPRDLQRRGTREVMIYAFGRFARSDPPAAAEALKAARLPEADRRAAWARVGYEGARRLLPEALGWYKLAGDAEMSDEQLAWKARAALRAGDWQAVREAIDPMSVTARADPTWNYWYGRALAAQGNADGARAYYLRVGAPTTFYGVLAAEELGYIPAPPEPFHAPTEQEVKEAQANPGLARALELYRLDLRTEGTREWFFTIRAMDDNQLLAAAELARRNEVWDRVINTAERTTAKHNYRARYLAPYREVFQEHSRAAELEEAWVLGLVRQESRFITNAKSSAGAKGLMQLMPATAAWVAKRNGMHDFSQARVIEVPTNVNLGTRYLKYVLDDLKHPVLASAAYNAGPGRARRWRDAKPLEGAVYAESIPFNETRDYVKKVMANTMYYAQLYGGQPVPLKTRMGTIPARSAFDRFNEELP